MRKAIFPSVLLLLLAFAACKDPDGPGFPEHEPGILYAGQTGDGIIAYDFQYPVVVRPEPNTSSSFVLNFDGGADKSMGLHVLVTDLPGNIENTFFLEVTAVPPNTRIEFAGNTLLDTIWSCPVQPGANETSAIQIFDHLQQHPCIGPITMVEVREFFTPTEVIYGTRIDAEMGWHNAQLTLETQLMYDRVSNNGTSVEHIYQQLYVSEIPPMDGYITFRYQESSAVWKYGYVKLYLQGEILTITGWAIEA